MIDDQKPSAHPAAGAATSVERRRWAEDGGVGDPVQERIATLFTKLEAPPQAEAPQLFRMRARLNAAILQPRSARRSRVWVWALAGSLLLLSSGVVVAARGWVPHWIARRPALAPAPRSPAPAARSHRTDRIGGAPTPAPAPVPPAPVAVADQLSLDRQPGEAPAGSPRVAAPPGPRSVRSPAAVAMGLGSRPRATEAAADSEAALLETAVARLRRDRDAAGALRILDRYDRRFAVGVLGGEATRLRVDALLLMEDRARALALLQALTLSSGARDVELALIRGELLAAGGDCLRALADFDEVSAAAMVGGLRSRARAGRIDCEKRLGQPTTPTQQ